tara:strand:- start:235 stop:2061 length:1827 start_codon:yes stop_codon:yes gene_type:complete
MKIIINYHKDNIKWKSNWVFIGKNYSNLRNVEKKIDGKRHNINDLIHKVFDREIQRYLFWTEQQRILHKDSDYWWMTDLAGKNNLNSDFFLFICHIYSVLDLISNLKKKGEKEILIICDDVYLIKTLGIFLKEKKFKVTLPSNFFIIRNLLQNCRIFFKILLSIISSIHWIIISKLEKKGSSINSENNILIHYSMDVNKFKKEFKLENRYFPYLKDHLKKKSKNIFHLVWFYNFWFNRLKVLKKIRENSGFIVEDFINFKDVIIGTKSFIKTKKTIINCNNYYDIKIKYLLERESKNYLNDCFSNLRFWFYKPALQKWSKKINSLICIDHYENMVFEHALIGSIRNLQINKKTIYGYHHTLASKEFTAWQSLPSEWESKFKPDYVISCGKLSNNLLQSQGIPPERIIEGPALRYNNLVSDLENKINSKKNYKIILFPLSKIKDSSIELVDKALALGKMLSETDFKLIIKPHPDFPLNQNYLQKISSNHTNIYVSEKNINELLNESGFSIFMATGAAYDAILKGSITLTLKSELNLSDNYLDIFKKNCDFIDSYDLLSLKELLIKLNSDNNELNNYKKKYSELRNLIMNGFNRVNEESLNIFSLDKNGN